MHGAIVNQIYLENTEGIPAFDHLAAEFAADDQHTAVTASTRRPDQEHRPHADLDVQVLRTAWQHMTDVHEFSRLIKDLGIKREQAFELIGSDFAYRVDASALPALLDHVKQNSQPVMIFVGNNGMTQIYNGTISTIQSTGESYLALNQDMRLHLQTANIHHGWVVRRPARNGIITSVEFYDAQGEQIVNVFSRRGRNTEESPAWRKIVAGLTKHPWPPQ